MLDYFVGPGDEDEDEFSFEGDIDFTEYEEVSGILESNGF